jgi:hypothetical protein
MASGNSRIEKQKKLANVTLQYRTVLRYRQKLSRR